MYINGQNVGSTLMAVTVDKEQDDLTEFSTVKFWIDGKVNIRFDVKTLFC